MLVNIPYMDPMGMVEASGILMVLMVRQFERDMFWIAQKNQLTKYV